MRNVSPTLELETEPEHRLTTLQYFDENVAAIRNGTNERFKWAVNGRFSAERDKSSRNGC